MHLNLGTGTKLRFCRRGEPRRATRVLLDDGVDVVGAHEQVVLAVDLDLVATELAVDDDVASWTSSGMRSPLSFILPAPTAMTVPRCGFS